MDAPIRPSTFLVYGLFDPRTYEIRYVGKTKNPLSKRLYGHKRDALEKDEVNGWVDQTYRANWLRTLLLSTVVPHLEVLQKCQSREEMNAAERVWIAQCRAAGCRLTNSTQGADGGHISRFPVCSDEQVLEAYGQGLSSAEIARKFGTCKKRVLVVIGKNGALRVPKSIPQGRISEGIADYKNGMTAPEVGKKFGVTANSVFYWLKQAGIKTRASADYRKLAIVDGSGRRFSSVTDAATAYGTRAVSISRVAAGERKSYKGQTFRYVDG